MQRFEDSIICISDQITHIANDQLVHDKKRTLCKYTCGSASTFWRVLLIEGGKL